MILELFEKAFQLYGFSAFQFAPFNPRGFRFQALE